MHSRLASFLPALLITSAATAQLGSFVKSGEGCPSSGTTPITDIGAADDIVNGPHNLGWTFTYVGGAGATTSIDIAPNGYIYLEAGTNTDSRCCSGSVTGAPDPNFLSATPSIACFGQDLNASSTGAGSIHFDTNNLDTATITWDHVAEFGNTGSSNTIVCTLRIDGSITIDWGDCALLTHAGLVGYSEGGGVADNGGGDWSAAPIVGVAGEALYEAFATTTFDLSNTSILLVPNTGSYVVVPNGVAPSREPISLDSTDIPTVGQTMNLDILDTPPGTALNVVFFGDATFGPIPLPGAPGCNVYTNALGSFVGAASSFPLAIPSTSTLVGAVFQAQGLSLVPNINPLEIITTNLGTITVGGQPIGITIGANGSNSFNSDTTSGFWSIQNATGLDITSLKVDFSINLAGKLFDTDQTGMADRFDGGNSTVASCGGTYRNGSNVAVGLVYTGTAMAPCDPAANIGWIGSNPLGTTGDFETLDFTFTDFNNGETFEFDADTDGIGGIGGDDMAGTMITVTLSDGSTHTGALVANGTDSAILIL